MGSDQMDYNSLDKGSQDRLINQVMQGYGRMKPSDRNAVVSYLSSNPDYANTVAARLGIQGANKADDRYENAQDSQAMRTLMKSMQDTPSQDVAKPAPAAKSGKTSKPVQKSSRYGVDGGGEGLNPRRGMQSEAASDEIARRQESGKEANRAGGFKNIAPNESDAPEANKTAKTEGEGTGTGSKVAEAAIGLGTGGAIGYGINRLLDNLFATETASAKSAKKLSAPAQAPQLEAPPKQLALPSPSSRALVPAQGREVVDPNAPMPAGPQSRMMLPQPEPRLAIDYQPGVTMDRGMSDDISEILSRPPGGAATDVGAVRGTDPTVNYANTNNIGEATMRSIRGQAKRMGRFK